MLEEDKNSEEGRGNVTVSYNNEFHTAVMEEDLRCIEEMSKKYGSNALIKAKDCSPGKVFLKVNATMPTLLTELHVSLTLKKTLSHGLTYSCLYIII